MSEYSLSASKTEAMATRRTKRRYLRRDAGRARNWWPAGWLPLIGLLLAFLWGLWVTAPSIEESTQDRVTQALVEAGYSGLEVEANGQEVRVQGVAPDALAQPLKVERTRLARIARGAACDDGWFANDLVPSTWSTRPPKPPPRSEPEESPAPPA